MALQNQLLFNLDVPIDKDKMAVKYHHPQPVVVEKCESEPAVPNVYQISQQVAEKFNAFEFISVSSDTLNTAVQLARQDMKKQKTHLPKPVEPVAAIGDKQQAQKIVGHVNRRQVKQKGDTKKASERTKARSLANKCKIHKTDDIPPASTSSLPTQDKADHHGKWMEEVVCMCEEMDCCLTKIRQLEETARNDPPRRFQVEDPSERHKRLIRIEEQKTRSTRILYTLSQKLREIDVTLARRPKPAKRNHLLRQLAAISRSSIRALHEFVQHLRDFNLAEGMPRIYDNLVVLLSQIIECFERLNPHSLKEGKGTDAANEMTPSEEVEKHLLGNGDQKPSQAVARYHIKPKRKHVIPPPKSSNPKKNKEPTVEETQDDKVNHPLSLLRQKYPTACSHRLHEAPSDISVLTGYSSYNAMSVVPPLSHSIPVASSLSRHSCGQQSIRSDLSMQRARTPSPMRITDQLEELLEAQDDLPCPDKRVHMHTPWVLEPVKPRRSRRSISPKHREERRQSPDPRYADPTISSAKKHSASLLKFEKESVRGRKQKAHTGAKQRSSSKSDAAGFSSQDDEKKTSEPETEKMTSHYSSDVVALRNEVNKQLSRFIEKESDKKKKIRTLLQKGKDHMDIDQLTEMILHEIMIDTVSQLSATTVSDDDTESNMSPTANSISAENILQRLDTIEAEQNQIRQRWDNLQYKAVPNDRPKTHSCSSTGSIIPKPIRLTGRNSSKTAHQLVKPGSSVKVSKSVSSTTSSNFKTAMETQPSERRSSVGRRLQGPARSTYGQSANNNNSHLVVVPMSEQLITSIINSQQQFQHYLKRNANMKVGRFDPWKVVDEVSEEILDVCVTEVCDELEQFNSDIVNHIYSSEFASESSSEVPEDSHHRAARCSTSPEPQSMSSAMGSGVSKNTLSDSHRHILERNWSPATGSSIKNMK